MQGLGEEFPRRVKLQFGRDRRTGPCCLELSPFSDRLSTEMPVRQRYLRSRMELRRRHSISARSKFR